MHKPRGFTLIELLIVIGIIALLAGILIPAIARARVSANRTRCAAQLQDVGRMLEMYFGENRSIIPHVNVMPSLQPPLNKFPSLVQLLAPYAKPGSFVFHCPSDRITQPTQNAPGGYESYFAREHSSYRWNAMVSIRHTRITELHGGGAKTILVDEYEPFHGPAGTSGSMNHLFADYHVGDFEGNIVIIIR